MGRINVLDKHVAELIAAGEVVERPSSVIKELVENAVDAGATSVTVEITDGGVTMMRVTDNGSGILRDDIRNAFVRHATSKVRVKEDLDEIGTLGFRGEALASISSVAKVELFTKSPDEEVGTHYRIEGGSELLLEDAGCPDGTTFVIRELFYNVPARMKFLKKNVSEGNAVAAVVDKIALSHSEVAFTFIRDHKQILVTQGDGNVKNCVYKVLGREFSQQSVRVDYELGGIGVSGYVSKPQASRASRAMQNFFINGRFVKSRTAMAAVEEACRGMVMVGKFPACVLYITIPYGLVDVNVHPAKIEVRFVNERPVFEAVYHAVKSALVEGDTAKRMRIEGTERQLVDRSVVQKPFTMSQHNISKIENEPVRRPFVKNDAADDRRALKIYKSVLEQINEEPKAIRLSDAAQRPAPSEPRGSVSLDIELDEELALGLPAPSADEDSTGAAREEKVTPAQLTAGEEKEEAPAANAENSGTDIEAQAAKNEELSDPPDLCESTEELQSEAEPPDAIDPLVNTSGDRVRFIGELFKTYILIEKNDEFVMIDKHALHERIIYEKLRREQGKKFAQYLLEPAVIRLSHAQYDAVNANLGAFLEAGFEIEDFGGSSVIVRSAPSMIDALDAAATVEEMAEHILEQKQNIESEYTDWLYHNIACRSAIKGGDKSSPEELMALYLKMGERPEYRYCPHGRPTSIVMTRYQIEKQFGRLG